MKKLSVICLIIGGIVVMMFCSSRPSTITFLDCQNNGDSAFRRGDYVEAEHQYRASLAIAENDGKENPLVLIALRSLGTNYMAWKKYAEAETIYKREIAVGEKLYGGSSPNMLTPLTDITWLYLQQGRFSDAEGYNNSALAIINKLSAAEHEEDRAVIQSQKEWIKRKQ